MGPLAHSPADVLRRVLIALGQGTDPAANAAWPVYTDGEPGLPDNVITLTDTDGRDYGRFMHDGRRLEKPGLQVRVRATTHKIGYAKARAIAVSLSEQLYDRQVMLDTTTYVVHAATLTSGVIRMGKETAVSRRSLYSINAVIGVQQL